jgi:hypothetical protein
MIWKEDMGATHSSEPHPASPPIVDAHLQLINPDYPTTAITIEPAFHPFPLLPTELRLKIWRCSLERRRILRIFIGNYDFHPDLKGVDQPNEDSHCYPVVAGYQSLSKLLRVNRESRQAAMEFYRVRIPCRFSANPDRRLQHNAAEMHQGTLCFSPEYDFVHISSEPPGQDTLIEFLHRLKTLYDSRGVGLLNLAVDINDLISVASLNPMEVKPGARQSFTETLSQLHSVYFVVHPHGVRQCEGWRSGYCDAVFFNRSMPILGTAPAFDVLPRDPRPIAQDLRRTYTGLDRGQRAFRQLQDLFKTWSAEPKNIQYRLLLGSQAPTTDGISSRASAKAWLVKEDEYWRWVAKGGKSPFGGKGAFSSMTWPPLKTPDEDLQTVSRPAVGFWLFPVQVITDPELGSGPLLDLSSHWPELALVSLP